MSFSLMVADCDDGKYLVSMLGEDANWLRNLRAAGGQTVLRNGSHQNVHLDHVQPEGRPSILRRHLS